MLFPIVGPPATGKTFFDREQEIKNIWSTLEMGSILLLGPRRFGKTSIMLELRNNPKENWDVFYIDTEWINTPTMFVMDIFTKALSSTSLKDKALRMIGKASSEMYKIIKSFAAGNLELSQVKAELHEQIKEEWIVKGQSLIQILNDSQTKGRKILFILDELPWMLNNMIEQCGNNETRQFLSWLRALRHTTEGWKNLRFVIGGYIGLEHILKKANAVSTVNDLSMIMIEGFNENKAREFIVELLKTNEVQCNDEVIEKVLEIIGIPAHPFFVQLLISLLGNEVKNRDLKEMSVENVNEVYWSKVMGPEGKIYFEHYYQRIIDYYSPLEADGAKEILAHLSTNPKMTKDQVFETFQRIVGSEDIKPNKLKEIFDTMMDDLLNDFYLEYNEEKNCYQFRYKILQDWWKLHHSIIGCQKSGV